MKVRTKKLFALFSLISSLAVSSFLSTNTAFAAGDNEIDATIPAYIFLDKTGTPIGEASSCNESAFNRGKHDTGKTWNDVAIVLQKDVSNYIIVDALYENKGGKNMTDVIIPYPVKNSTNYKGLYGYAVEAIGKAPVRVGNLTYYYPAFEVMTGETSNLKTIQIPSTVGQIYDTAFKDCKNLSSFSLTKSDKEEIRLYSYGKQIFSGCTSLKSISIPYPQNATITFSAYGTFNGSSIETVTFSNDITKIPDNAMVGTTTLKTVNYGDRVTTIGRRAFESCTNLTNFTFKSKITEIQDSAFNSSGLTTFKLPDRLEKIGNNTFANTPFTKVTIPGLVNTIGNNAFSSRNLVEATFAASVDSTKPRIKIPDNAMSGATALTKVTFPKTVVEIGNNAFRSTTSLTTIGGLDKIQNIGFDAFNLSGLSMDINLNNILSIGDRAFYQCTQIKKMTLGNKLEHIGSHIIANTQVEELVIPPTVKTCNGTPFAFAAKLTKLTFLGTEIPSNIFAEAKTVKTINLNKTITKVGDRAFYKCYNFSNNPSFEKVTEFGMYSVAACYSFTNKVNISNATKFGVSAFECAMMTDSADFSKYAPGQTMKYIKFTGTFKPEIELLGSRAFMGAYEFKIPVVLSPATPIDLGAQAFEGTSVTKADLNNFKSIGYQAFSINPSNANEVLAFEPCPLTYVRIRGGQNVSIGNYAFYECADVKSFSIKNAGITTIGDFAFYGMNELEKLDIPETVIRLSGGCFGGWSKLTSVTIPQKVSTCSVVLNRNTGLYHGPFTVCSQLKTLSLQEGMKVIPTNLFYHFINSENASITINIPNSVTSIAASGTAYNYPTFGGNVVKKVSLVFEGTPNAEQLAQTIAAQFSDGGRNVNIGIIINRSNGWYAGADGKMYWYEHGVLQGTLTDPQGVIGDGTVRGREIYDPVSNGWYWLDAKYNGAKAVDKEVWMPYIYQNEASWDDTSIRNAAALSGNMAEQVYNSIKARTGKWVRYDTEGKMYKGWYTVPANSTTYPSQRGNTYYYDPMTGLMAKGWTFIDNRWCYFDEFTGVYNAGAVMKSIDESEKPIDTDDPEAPIVDDPEAPIVDDPEAPIVDDPEAPIVDDPEAPIVDDEPEAPVDEIIL